MLEMLEKIHELSIIMTFPKKLPDGWLLIRTNHNGAFVDGNLGVDTTFVPRKSDPNTQFIYDLRFTIWEIPALAREHGEVCRLAGLLPSSIGSA